jgi:hypothetical protein
VTPRQRAFQLYVFGPLKCYASGQVVHHETPPRRGVLILRGLSEPTPPSSADRSKPCAQAGQVSRMTVEGGSFFLPIRHSRRKR